LPADLVILIPVFNDWEAITLLLQQLDRVAERLPQPVGVILIDDGSTEPMPDALRQVTTNRIASVEVLALRRNLGHQRALAVGFCHVESERPCRAVVVMDGDGEDSPDDVPRLLEEFERQQERRIVFAERRLRSESWLFRLFYHLFRVLHLILTGIPVRVGNYSVVPFALLSRLVVMSDLWNHYAACVMNGQLPFTTVPTTRAPRLVGRSHMSWIALVTHGLSALSVFSVRVGVRLLIAVGVLTALTLVALIATVVMRSFAPAALPKGTALTAGLLLVLLVQVFALLVVFVFVALSGREGASFLPLRDYRYFVAETRRLFPRTQQPGR
jgi:hypothetical protein